MATRSNQEYGPHQNRFTNRYNSALDSGLTDINEHSIDQNPIQSTPCEIAMQTLADETLHEPSSDINDINEDSLNMMVGSTPNTIPNRNPVQIVVPFENTSKMNKLRDRMVHQTTLIRDYKEKEAELKIVGDDQKYYKDKCLTLDSKLQKSKLKKRRLKKQLEEGEAKN